MLNNYIHKLVYIFFFFFVSLKVSYCNLHYLGLDWNQNVGGKWICVDKNSQPNIKDFFYKYNGGFHKYIYKTYNFSYPNKPTGNGVYVYFSQNGEIAYIGKSWQKKFNGIYDRIAAHQNKDLFGQPKNKDEILKEINGLLSHDEIQNIEKREKITKYCYLPIPNNSPRELAYYIEGSLLSIFHSSINSWQNGGPSGDTGIFNRFRIPIIRYTTNEYSMLYTANDENVNNYYSVFENPDFYKIFYYFKNYQKVEDDLENCEQELKINKNELKREISSIQKFLKSTNLEDAFHNFRIGYIKGHSKNSNQAVPGVTFTNMLSALFYNVNLLPKSNENVEMLIKILEKVQNDGNKNKANEVFCPQEKSLNYKIQTLEKNNEDARIVNNQLNSTINSNEIKNKDIISKQENEIITLKIENQKLKSNITLLYGEISILEKQLNGNITQLNGAISILEKQLNGNITLLNEEISSLNSIITDYERNNTILTHQAELDSFELKSYDQCIIDRNRYKMESEKSPFNLKQYPSLVKIDDVSQCPKYKCLKRKSLNEWTIGLNIPAFCRESRYDCSLCYKYIECSFSDEF